MGERPTTPECRPGKRALALLAVCALAACGSESAPKTDTMPPKPMGGNFDINYPGYEPPLSLNCQTGPYERLATFEGNTPKAYVFEVKDTAGHVLQALRLKIFGSMSDMHATLWAGNEDDQSVPPAKPSQPSAIPLEPGVEIRIRHISEDPYSLDIQALCI